MMSFNVGVTPNRKGEKMINKVVSKAVEPQVVRASTYIEEKVAPKVSKLPEYFSPCTPVETAVNLDKAVKPAGVGDVLHFFG